jgi:acetyltransferase-like isoleucine patch superfamily enzyme
MIAYCVMIARATLGDRVKIQNHTNVSNNVVIEDDVFIGSGVQFCNSVHPTAAGTDELQTILVRKKANVGSNVCLIGAITIGEGARVGAGSVVMQDVPDYALVVGNPARIVHRKEPQ